MLNMADVHDRKPFFVYHYKTNPHKMKNLEREQLGGGNEHLRDGIHSNSRKELRRFSGILSYNEWRDIEEQKAFQEIQRDREWIEKKYNVNVKILFKEEMQSAGGINMRPTSSLIDRANRLSALKKQIMKIPPSFFAKLGIKTIVLAREYIEIDRNGNKRKLAGLEPGLNAETIYVTGGGAFYHEIFHAMDAIRGGLESMGAQTFEEYRRAYEQNAAWHALEPDIRVDYDEEQAGYCRFLFNLDNAEDYESFYKPYMERPGKQAKIERMKKWLLDLSNGKLDKQFWQDLRDGKVDEEYWDHR